jgi:hypothetical protein
MSLKNLPANRRRSPGTQSKMMITTPQTLSTLRISESSGSEHFALAAMLVVSACIRGRHQMYNFGFHFTELPALNKILNLSTTRERCDEIHYRLDFDFSDVAMCVPRAVWMRR